MKNTGQSKLSGIYVRSYIRGRESDLFGYDYGVRGIFDDASYAVLAAVL